MNNNFDPDLGGGKGYSIAFTEDDAYASISTYFTASNQWPVNQQTFSVWMRWIGVSPNGFFSSPFSVITANDNSHGTCIFSLP